LKIASASLDGNHGACSDLSLSAMPELDPKRIANEIIESIDEEPKIEPGQADETPANDSKTPPKEGRFEHDRACPDQPR
jgi:hypothetical protein